MWITFPFFFLFFWFYEKNPTMSHPHSLRFQQNFVSPHFLSTPPSSFQTPLPSSTIPSYPQANSSKTSTCPNSRVRRSASTGRMTEVILYLYIIIFGLRKMFKHVPTVEFFCEPPIGFQIVNGCIFLNYNIYIWNRYLFYFL